VASDLKWRTGFGWGAALLPICSGLAALLLTGAARWLALAITVLAGGFIIYQYRRWNGHGWRQVHFRAMLAYSGIAGLEAAAAREAGRDFDVHGACSTLGLLLCGEDNRAAVENMLSELARQRGSFLAGLVERHAGEVLRGAPIELRHDVVARLRGVTLGPHLVIASVIENTYGELEAARYAVAVATGDAGSR
jgi:hypothetical protein